MERNEILGFLKKHVSESRLQHCLGVESIAMQLAARFNAPLHLVSPAALLHDLCREYSSDLLLKLASKFGIVIDDIEEAEPLLLHGSVAAGIVRYELGLDEPDLLEAITYHITGASNLGALAHLIFVADSIEPGRNYPAASVLRENAFVVSPDQLLLQIFDQTIKYLVNNGYFVHPRTIAGRNELIKKGVLKVDGTIIKNCIHSG